MRLLPFALTALAPLATLFLGAETQKPAASVPASEAKDAKDAKEAKRKDTVRLLKLIGWPATNSEAARQQLQNTAKDPKFAGYPAAYWKDFDAAASPEAFEKILVPLFDKTYSHDEIKSFLKLLNSPEFKLFVEKNPDTKVKKEAFEAFSKYMTETSSKLQDKHGLKGAAPAKK
jgi:uncharacterized protein